MRRKTHNPNQKVLFDSPPNWWYITQDERDSGKKWIPIVRQTMTNDSKQISLYVSTLEHITIPDEAYDNCPEAYGEFVEVKWPEDIFYTLPMDTEFQLELIPS